MTPDAKQRCTQGPGPPSALRPGGPDLPSRGADTDVWLGLWVFASCVTWPLGVLPTSSTLPHCHLAESTSPPSGPQDVAGPSASLHVGLSASALCFSLFLELFHKTMPAAGGHQHAIQHCQARFWEPVKEEWVSFLASGCSGSVFGPATSLVSDTGLRIKTCSPSLILGPPPSLSQRAPVTLAVLPDTLGRCMALPLLLHHFSHV